MTSCGRGEVPDLGLCVDYHHSDAGDLRKIFDAFRGNRIAESGVMRASRVNPSRASRLKSANAPRATVRHEVRHREMDFENLW